MYLNCAPNIRNIQVSDRDSADTQYRGHKNLIGTSLTNITLFDPKQGSFYIKSIAVLSESESLFEVDNMCQMIFNQAFIMRLLKRK